jgi:hypothetical protein
MDVALNWPLGQTCRMVPGWVGSCAEFFPLTRSGTSSILGGVAMAALTTAAGTLLDRDSLVHAVLHLEQMLTTGGGWQDQVCDMAKSETHTGRLEVLLEGSRPRGVFLSCHCESRWSPSHCRLSSHSCSSVDWSSWSRRSTCSLIDGFVHRQDAFGSQSAADGGQKLVRLCG